MQNRGKTMKILKNAFLALSFVTHGALYAQEIMFNHFVSCTSVMDGRPVTLDFFEEIDIHLEKSTNKGYVVQTMETLSGENIKMMGKITLAGDRQKTINMYGLLTPSMLFAAFIVDLEKKIDVEISVVGFNVVWGKFSCEPTVFANVL